jgi:hypothetical protein
VSITAADLLNDRVPPFHGESDLRPLRVPTNRGGSWAIQGEMDTSSWSRKNPCSLSQSNAYDEGEIMQVNQIGHKS